MSYQPWLPYLTGILLGNSVPEIPAASSIALVAFSTEARTGSKSSLA